MPKNSNKKILLTGFAPFNKDTINPSWEVVKKLQGKKINGKMIIGMRLPVVFGKAGRLVINAIKKYQPELVISLGQYTGASLILLERVGLNIHLGRDENKIKPENEFISPGGTTAYFVRLPFKTIISKLKKKGIPVNISFNAGTHLCNEVLYTTLDYVATHKLPTKVGFIHIPMLPEQVARRDKPYPSMSLETMVKGVKAIIESCL
ncbi:MAG: pyroglutamyl-peptidase I [Planctomycetota bacterium]